MENNTFQGPLAAAFGAVELSSVLAAADDALPLAPASDRAVWAAPIDRVAVDLMITTAEAERDAPWPQPLASDAARFHRDGDRETWESATFERQRRVTRAAIAAAVTLEPRWIDTVADGITLLCEQSSWCWPAHDDAFEVHGSIVPVADDPYVDLGAGELVAQLAWIDHLLGAQLDERYPGLRARIRHEASLRVFTPFLARMDW